MKLKTHKSELKLNKTEKTVCKKYDQRWNQKNR